MVFFPSLLPTHESPSNSMSMTGQSSRGLYSRGRNLKDTPISELCKGCSLCLQRPSLVSHCSLPSLSSCTLLVRTSLPLYLKPKSRPLSHLSTQRFSEPPSPGLGFRSAGPRCPPRCFQSSPRAANSGFCKPRSVPSASTCRCLSLASFASPEGLAYSLSVFPSKSPPHPSSFPL